MKFDNSKFESNAQTTMSTIDKLKQALKFDNASKGLEEVSHAAANVKMDGISDACEAVQAKFSALQVAAYTVLSNITTEAYQAGKKIVDALTIEGARDGFNEYEQKMGSVQTIMNSTGESLGTVMNYLEELNKYADQTIYSFSDMTTNIGKFTNAGVKLEDAVAAIKGVSNEAAVSGANANEASRAMYNFAQALSAGYVKLIDWKSIENANMATVEFKNELIKTAEAVGTLVKEEDLYKTVTTDAKGKVSDLFDATHAFNESLSHEWMTTEVLTKTLAKYADENTDLGKKAYAAAQDVKTFSMMMDTLKEAIGSGWAVTWERFIGDFEHAKKIFTNITNAVSDVIEKQADARNKFVSDAFNKEGLTDPKEWALLKLSIEGAGGNLSQFKKIVTDVAKANGVAVDDIIKQYGSFEKSLESGWLTSDIFDQAVAKIDKLGQVAPGFRALASAISVANKPFQDLKTEIDKVSGRMLLFDALTNVIKSVIAVITPMKEAFREIFPPKSGRDLRDALEKFKDFTETLMISEEVAEKIKIAFRGLFKVIQSGIGAVKDIFSAFSPLVDIVKILAKNFFEAAFDLGNFFDTLEDGDESTSLFKKVLEAIHDTLETFANNLQTYIDNAKEALASLKDRLSESWNTGALSIVAAALENIKGALGGFTESLSGGLKTFLDLLTQKINGEGFQKVVDILTKFGEGLKTAYGYLKQSLQPIIDKLRDFFGQMDFLDSIGMMLEAGGFASVAAFLGRMADNLLDFKDQMFGLVEAIKAGNPLLIFEDFLTGVTDTLGGLEDKLRSDVITNFAVSIGILAASIFVLSTIDAEKAKQSVTLITVLLGELVYIFSLLKRSKFGSLDTENGLFGTIKSFISNTSQIAALANVSSILLKLAASVAILALAMKTISDIPPGPLAASFVAVSVLLWELVGVTEVLSKSEAKMVKGTGALIGMAAAVMILATAMKIIASIAADEDTFTAAIVSVIALILELTLVMQVLNGNKGVKGAGALIAMATAILILSGAMKVFATMNATELGKGLLVIAALLIELVAALTFLEAGLPGAAALIVAAGALLVMAGALKVLSTIDTKQIGPLLGLLGGVLLELSIALNAMMLALPGAAALIVAAGAIAILTPAILALAAADPKKVFTALGELAVALVAIGGVSAVLGIASPLILSFAVALGVLSLAIIGIGVGVATAGAGLFALATALGMVAEIGKESAERIVETLQIILKGIILLIPDIVEAFGQGIVRIADVIVKGMPTIKAALLAIVEVMIQVFTESIPDLAKAFGAMLLSLMETVAEYAPQLWDSFLTMVNGVLAVINEHLPELIQTGVDIMVSLIQGFQSMQNQLIDAAMEAMIAFINGLADSVDRYAPQLLAAIKKLFNAIIDAMLLILFNGDTKLAKKAKEMMVNMKNAINSKIQEIVGVIADMISRMIGKINERIHEFTSIGRNLVQGFINGVRENVGAAVDAVRSMGGSALDALKHVLRTASPSKATYEIGDFYGQGFVNAVEDGRSKVGRASAQLGETALRELANALDDRMEFSPTITPVLDLSEVERGASKLGEMSNDWDSVSVEATANVANKAAAGFNTARAASLADNQNGLDLLKSAISALNNADTGVTQNNTFNITGGDPRAIADEVSRVLQMQVERRGAVWA